MAQNQDTLYDVAIVGFGPSGAVAAALLGQAGLRVHVCDRMHGVYEIPRAIALDHEIMRVFQQVGIVEAIAQHFEPFTDSEYFGADGRLIRRMTMLPPPHPQGYTPSLVFTQPPVERALRERVARMPNVSVALGTEMRSLEQDGDSVTLSLQAEDGRESTVRARYAIACDGGSSATRALLGIELEDLDFDEPWLVVDVLANEKGLAKLPRTSVQYCEPERPCTYVIGPKNHRRWEISLKEGEDPRQAATPEGTWKLLERWIGPQDGELWRQASYRFHALVAAEWRRGRVFVAGDAAHMQPPFLGQGMCQGVRDVANLSWKLAAVLRGEVAGEAAERLLDSYGQERKPHVRELTSRIKAVGAVICERDPARARERDARLLAECGGTVRDTPRQDVLPRLEQGLLQREPSSARGTLFPQPWVLQDGERVRFDAVAGPGWRLVLDARLAAFEPPPGLACVRVGSTAEAGAIAECDGVLEAWFRRNECGAALVRPDHYVFGIAADAAALSGLVEEWAARLR